VCVLTDDLALVEGHTTHIQHASLPYIMLPHACLFSCWLLVGLMAMQSCVVSLSVSLSVSPCLFVTHCLPCRVPLLLPQSQVSGLQRERAKLSILQDAVIVASTLSFAGGYAATAQLLVPSSHGPACTVLSTALSCLHIATVAVDCGPCWLHLL
jgi:hypothetical protein